MRRNLVKRLLSEVRMSVLKSNSSLEGEGKWQAMPDENKAQMRFFRVEVVLP